MPTDSIINDFVDEANTFAANLEGFSRRQIQHTVGILKQLEADLIRQIDQISPTDVRRMGARFNRQQKLLAQARKTIDQAYRDLNNQQSKLLRELGSVSQDTAVAHYNAIFGVEMFSAVLTPGRLRAIADETIVMGGPAGEWWRKQSINTRQRFFTEMRLGILQGNTNQELIQRVRGKSTGVRQVVFQDGSRKVITQFSGGLMDTTTRQAAALVRTSVQNVNNNIRMEMFRENRDVISAVQALVTLDNRTTILCMSRSGAVWDINTGDPLENTQDPWPGPPPWHWNCRTTLIPITKSFEELGLGGKRGKTFREIPKAKQASMDGQVAGDLTYEGWLRTKPKSFQIQVLGPGRWELWNAGKLSFSQLVDGLGRTRTLEQLREAI